VNQFQYSAARPLAAQTESANDILWVTYRWMSVGLGITGLVAWLVSQSPEALNVVVGNRIVFYVLLFAQLGMVFAFSAVAQRASTAVAAAMFFAYAALTGLTFSVIFLVYTAASIASTFLVTAGTFAGISAFGAVTKRDLSAVGRFAVFALIGLIIASVVNIFLHSTGLMWLTTFAGILIFAALTAYDTQKLKAMYASGMGGNLALRGALTLYLDFINMFLFLLRLFGQGRNRS
jgi:FtsH-binding integral membrane protein